MSDAYYESCCPFCEKNLLLSYFCQNCASVFCEECVHFALTDELVCATCGSREISMENMTALECKECKSRHIASVQKHVKTCPSCSSDQVTKIVDKFDLLRNRFKNIITNSKQFLSPLVYAADTISIQKEKLIRLREDSVKICHYPRLEMELLQLIKLFKDGKHAIQAKTGDFFQHINRNFKIFFEIEKNPPRLIPVLEAELESIEKSAESIISYGNSTNEKLEEKFIEVRTKIEFMDSLYRLFMRYISVLGINIDYNEKPVFGIRGKLGDTNQPDTNHSIKPGTILVTNRKIYYLHEKGWIKKQTQLILSLQLDKLTRVRVKGVVLKKLVLEFGNEKYVFQLPKKNLSQLESYIEKARVFDNNRLDREMLYGLKHENVTIQEFRNALESTIISLIGYKNAILDDDDPFGVDQVSQFDNMVDSSPYQESQYYYQPSPPPQHHYRHQTPQNQFQYQQHPRNTPPYSQYEKPPEEQQREKINLLHSIYQKRLPLEPVKEDPTPRFHQQGTISNPYQPPLSRNSSYSSYEPNKPAYPFKSHTSSILEKVRQVIPDEAPYIPQPPEVQRSQNMPEIDVSTLVPTQEFPEKLLRLEEQYIWLQRKIDMLQKRRDEGKISEDAFLRMYESAFKELYRTENYIKQLKKRNPSL
ncbi:MAG: hypothetical protein EU530_07475 [Promethearchaeota archaeon]|nr:MAG: hypothetical protein EU530_07475 [Candidatus Lokiarchaeota archaeon]